MAKQPSTHAPHPAVPAGSQPFIAAPQAAAAAAHAGPVTTDMDYPAHEAMYHRFTDLVKWGIVGAVVLVIFLFIVIHPFVGAPPT